MQIILLYATTAIIFLGLDAIALRLLMKPLFTRHIGDWLLEGLRFGPAIAFYLFYVAGVVWFVSLPALAAGSPGRALLAGGLLGALAYGTYEFTNYATLSRWHWQMVVTDLAWGTVLTGTSAALGVIITRAISN